MGRGRVFFLALVAGAAAALGHAPFGLWPISLAGFVAVTWLVSGSFGLNRRSSASGMYPVLRRPVLAAWAGGLGYFAVSLHWIVEPFLVDAATHGWMAPFALALLAGGLALLWAAAGWVSTRLAGSAALSFAVCLAAVEMVRGHIFTGFPWALPAYIWADTWLLSLAAYVGPYGLTAVTLLLVALLSELPRRWPLPIATAAVLTGIGLYSQDAAPKPKPIGTVRLGQPNAPQDEKWDPEKAHGFVDRALAFTAAPKDGVDLVVWPETAIPYPLDLAGPLLPRLARAADGVPVVSGINRRTDEGTWFNSAILVDATGEVAETYDKVHLVPFGEYIPLRIDFIRALAASSGYGFTAGDGVRNIETALGKTVPLICYEAIFPSHSRGLPERQDYLLQITNDAWFGTFSGPYQHLDQARFRAVEQGLSLVRAANTGVSAVIDPNGRVLRALPLGEAGYIDVPVPAGSGPTPYSRTGDWPVAFILLSLIALLFVTGRRNAIANRMTSS